jgi:rhodanese-related sulfurtransferase
MISFRLASILIASGILLLLLSGCESKKTEETPSAVSENKPKAEVKYMKISAKEAKNIIDTGKDFIILDVRTVEEYNQKHIPKSILIPYDEIETQAPSKLNNKNQTILVYCRTGRRSAIASETLIKLGYTNVLDFGGINDWSYETQTVISN